MYMVYWSVMGSAGGIPQSREFDSSEMHAALQFMEGIRMRQRAGEAIAFVTMCSENPDSVGLAGVAEPDADYQWKKRRS